MKNLDFLRSLEIIDVVDFRRRKMKYYTKKRNFNVLSIRVSGEAEFTHNKIVKVIDGKLLFIPKNIEYSQSTEGEHVIAVHFKGKAPYNDIAAFDTDADKVKKMFYDIFKFYRLKTEEGYYMAHCRLYKALALTFEKMKSGQFKDKITAGYDMIKMHYTSPDIRVDNIVYTIGVSGAYFRREFKKRYGISPKQMINNLRLDNSAVLLENGYCNVGEVALQSGFSDPNYFSAVFKRRFGVPPIEYAKLKVKIK